MSISKSEETKIKKVSLDYIIFFLDLSRILLIDGNIEIDERVE